MSPRMWRRLALLLLLSSAVLSFIWPRCLRADDLLEQLRVKQRALQQASAAPAAAPQIEVFFSPGGGCTAAIVRELNAAKRTIRVQAYSFTSAQSAFCLWLLLRTC